MIEEGTHLRLKTKHMAVNSDILVWRDGRTYGWMDGWTYGRTDTASYRDAMDASKKYVNKRIKIHFTHLTDYKLGYILSLK